VTARAMIMLFVLTIVLRTGFMFVQRYARRLNAFYDDWNGKESPEKRRHRECLEHIARMEKELGLYEYPSFAEVRGLRNPDGSFRTPKTAGSPVFGEIRMIGGQPFEWDGLLWTKVPENLYAKPMPMSSVSERIDRLSEQTRHLVPTPSCSCAICADFTNMTVAARRLRNELVQSYGIPT
jgi:hypothetical protein